MLELVCFGLAWLMYSYKNLFIWLHSNLSLISTSEMVSTCLEASFVVSGYISCTNRTWKIILIDNYLNNEKRKSQEYCNTKNFIFLEM